MTRAVYPGSFDPVTNGHLDIVKRTAELFDELIVAVLVNSSKNPLFSVEERVALLKEATKDYKNVKIGFFDGLLVNFVEENDIDVIVKGLRAVSDFESELQMAAMNRKLNRVETVFMMTATEYSYLSSSLVKEVSRLGGDVSTLVPKNVEEQLLSKFKG
jgi:pantetheine-phosphate adenylyltransferase